ncbi:hypothetical protein OS493_013629 [Desmophyllum pertusum]|uniref:Uncharacterized protein n=1 Tax=Desmophyllum pertusum TaxID=174260 RepID=A0A9X0A2J5_9CNID|nr:hypothetical protein OS493_013629 [Desmophyllum pertusum]
MLLNFTKIYFPVAPEIRQIDDGNQIAYVRTEVVITPNVPYTLQEYCIDLVKKIVLPQNIHQLHLPQTIIREISA